MNNRSIFATLTLSLSLIAACAGGSPVENFDTDGLGDGTSGADASDDGNGDDGGDDRGDSGPADDGGPADTGADDGPPADTGADDGPADTGADTGGDDGGPSTSCCTPRMEPGCPEDDVIEECVCSQDAFCCDMIWDDVCVAEVSELGCGMCEAGDGGGTDGGTDGGGDGGNAGDCCEAGVEPGCSDADIEACVCAEDAFCCETAWDDLCVSHVNDLGCGMCEGGGDGGGDGDCCEAQPGPGCNDMDIQDCVCAQDAFCCDTLWDEICVGEVDELGCGTCA